MKKFLDWIQDNNQKAIRETSLNESIDEAIRHHFVGDSFNDNPIAYTKNKDALGLPRLQKPGYSAKDVRQINRESPDVATMLDEATKKLGVHWIVMYVEPEEGTKETPSDWIWKMRRDPDNEWDKYKNYSHGHAENALKDFISGKEGGAHTVGDTKDASPSNTIVYIKPTSRVHGLSPWQQVHNIGHAIWGHNTHQLSKFVEKLRMIVYEIQQSKYQKEGNKPNAWEILVTLARVLDLKSYQRIFSLKPGDLQIPAKKVNTAFNSFMEGMIDLVAAYLNNKGVLPFKPRPEIEGGNKKINRFGRTCYTVGTPDRQGKMEPNPEIQAGDWRVAAKQRAGNFPGSGQAGHEKPLPVPTRDWCWEPINLDPTVWKIAATGLSDIIEEAILNCTWAKQGGPIYATKEYITTQP